MTARQRMAAASALLIVAWVVARFALRSDWLAGMTCGANLGLNFGWWLARRGSPLRARGAA